VRALLLPGALLAVWVWSWWFRRSVRLWLAVLAPFGSVVLIVLAFLSVPAGSCDHGCVEGWAASMDGSESLADALLTLPVALAVTVITGLVELVGLFRRGFGAPHDRAATAPAATEAPDDRAPEWSDLWRGPTRREDTPRG
jgi:hypothetical protein